MDDWQALLDDIEEYLDDHMDVNDGDDGRPVPNRAMSLHTRLTTLRALKERVMTTVEKGQTWVHHAYTYPAGAVEVLGVTDTHVEFTPAGGGFVYRGPIEAFVGQHVLRAADALDPPWIAARFELESDEGPWPGYWQGYRWNGWATPEFERDVVRAILDAVEAAWTEEGDVFVLTDNVNGEADPVRLEPRAVVIDGVTKQLYAFDGWCFSVARELPRYHEEKP